LPENLSDDDEINNSMRGTYIVGKDNTLYDFVPKSVIFKSESGPTEKDKLTAITPLGDDMNQWLWDGPEDSDEEIEEMVVFKNEFEKQ
jgi:hypothetical protein